MPCYKYCSCGSVLLPERFGLRLAPSALNSMSSPEIPSVSSPRGRSEDDQRDSRIQLTALLYTPGGQMSTGCTRKFSVRHLRQLCNARGQLLVGRDDVGHLVVVELLIGDKIEIARAGQTEDDGLFLARFLALERFVDRGADGVAGLRGGEDALGAGKILRCLETRSSARRCAPPSVRHGRAGTESDSCRGSAGRPRGWARG